MEADPPSDTGELRARIHFIKVFSIIAEHHGFQWSIVGGFLRRLFSGAPITGDLDLLLTNRAMSLASTSASASASATAIHSLLSVNSHFQKVIKELEILGFIRDAKGSISTGYTGTVMICVSDYTNDSPTIREVVFELVVKLSSMVVHKPECSTDSLALTSSTGLVSTSIDTLDRLNPSPGIIVLERLAELRTKTVTICGTYVNGDDVQSRKANSQLMMKEYALWLEGFECTGNAITRGPASEPGDNCPICFEGGKPVVELQCKHVFCVPCLAQHMSLRGESHGRCPLCRWGISWHEGQLR
jgi:hypothetical protein